jgi:adenylate cyclase
MLSPKSKRNLYRVIPFALIWLFFSIIYTLLEKGLLANLDAYPATGNPYNFSNNILITPLTALITGLIIGTIEIRWLNKLFVHKSFTGKIIIKTLIYLAFIISFLLGLAVIANTIELKTSIFSKEVWKNVLDFFSSFAFWSVEIYITAIIFVSLFYTEVSENLGQEVLNNFFTGKYHTPTEEERIFMFSDMRSSTTIAESLGHLKYFEMLKEYYSDLSDSIIRHSGEIYQYVGDEIIVSWKLRNGLKNNNCIQCFYSMKNALKKQSKKYHERFGVLPDFKAGLHFGEVTTGEIGVIKKDITFSGDVLNTTARIQGLCNAYEVDILISEILLKKIKPEFQFKIIELGENELRGRDEKIKLFTIQPL